MKQSPVARGKPAPPRFATAANLVGTVYGCLASLAILGGLMAPAAGHEPSLPPSEDSGSQPQGEPRQGCRNPLGGPCRPLVTLSLDPLRVDVDESQLPPVGPSPVSHR